MQKGRNRRTQTPMNEAYPFQSSQHERQRLIAQDGLLARSTQRLFENAGIRAGMHILDIGSGAGDVALLAARAAGPRGRVTGIDRDPAQATFAPQRAAQIPLQDQPGPLLRLKQRFRKGAS
jgi:ubiquinone/menaquinone biosynthesis C-methylase UbiE